MSISPPPGAQLGLGLDVRNVPVCAAVPRGTPDNQKPNVVLRIQRCPLPGLAAQPEAPLPLSPLLRSCAQHSPQSSSISISRFNFRRDRDLCATATATERQADARDAWGPLPLLNDLLMEMQDIDGTSVWQLSIKFCDSLMTRSITHLEPAASKANNATISTGSCRFCGGNK